MGNLICAQPIGVRVASAECAGLRLSPLSSAIQIPREAICANTSPNLSEPEAIPAERRLCK